MGLEHCWTDTNRTVTLRDWSTVGLIVIGLEHYGMGHTGVDTNRTVTLWNWSTVGSENEPRGGERRDRQGSHVTSCLVVSV